MKQDLLYEALAEIIYGTTLPLLTRSERGKINRALLQLREVGATPDEIRKRAGNYLRVMPKGCQLTALGLAGNWTKCGSSPRKPLSPSHEPWKGL